MVQSLAKLENAIHGASSYQEFKEACIAHDSISGADDWKSDDRSKDFDYRLIRKRVSRLKLAHSRGDILALMSCLHEGIHGNLGNISNPILQENCKIGTKHLIEEFINEVCNALEEVSEHAEHRTYRPQVHGDETLMQSLTARCRLPTPAWGRLPALNRCSCCHLCPSL